MKNLKGLYICKTYWKNLRTGKMFPVLKYGKTSNIETRMYYYNKNATYKLLAFFPCDFIDIRERLVQEIEAAKVKALTSTYWANWWQVYGLGQTGSLEGVCITDWQEIDLPADARILCYGMDFGYSNDPTSLVTMYKYNDAYIFDEVIYKKGLLNSEISNLLKANNVNEDDKEILEETDLGNFGLYENQKVPLDLLLLENEELEEAELEEAGHGHEMEALDEAEDEEVKDVPEETTEESTTTEEEMAIDPATDAEAILAIVLPVIEEREKALIAIMVNST